MLMPRWAVPTWASWDRTAACSTARWYIGPLAQAATAVSDSSQSTTDWPNR